MVTLNIDKHTCENIADFLELYFFQNIREDEDMDNIEYVHDLIHAIGELRRVATSGDGGMTNGINPNLYR